MIWSGSSVGSWVWLLAKLEVVPEKMSEICTWAMNFLKYNYLNTRGSPRLDLPFVIPSHKDFYCSIHEVVFQQDQHRIRERCSWIQQAGNMTQIGTFGKLKETSNTRLSPVDRWTECSCCRCLQRTSALIQITMSGGFLCYPSIFLVTIWTVNLILELGAHHRKSSDERLLANASC